MRRLSSGRPDTFYVFACRGAVHHGDAGWGYTDEGLALKCSVTALGKNQNWRLKFVKNLS